MARRPAIKIEEDPDLSVVGSYVDFVEWQLASRRFASKSERTRARLKVAAARILEKTGFQDMRVSDICEMAGVALGTFYNYFEDKRAIAVDVTLEFGEELYAVARRVAGGKSAFDAILSTNRFFISIYQRNSGLVRCLIQLDDQVPEFQKRWREIRARWIARIAASIAKRSEKPGIDEETRIRVAYILECMVFQHLYDVFVRREPRLGRMAGSADEIAELVSVLWYRAIYCENPSPEEISHARKLLRLRRRGSADAPHGASGPQPGPTRLRRVR